MQWCPYYPGVQIKRAVGKFVTDMHVIYLRLKKAKKERVGTMTAEKKLRKWNLSYRRRINFNNGWHHLMVKHRKKNGRTHKNQTKENLSIFIQGTRSTISTWLWQNRQSRAASHHLSFLLATVLCKDIQSYRKCVVKQCPQTGAGLTIYGSLWFGTQEIVCCPC